MNASHLHLAYGTKVIYDDCNFRLDPQDKAGIVGVNGAGKTTTIRIIMDIFHANEGQILLNGQKFEPSKNQVGYLPEERGMYPKKTVMEQMIYFARLRGLDKNKAAANAAKWLERLQVSEYAKRKMDTLSKGNQQKVQLAATLVSDPDIIILDEPFSGLDPVNSQILKEVIRELIADNRIVIFSSHQMSYVEEFCEDISIVNKGEIVLDGNLDEIKADYGRGRKILAAVNMSLTELEQCCQDKLSDLLEVEGRTRHNIIFRLKEQTDSWQILDRIRTEQIEIDHYGSYEPSLNDIFVSCVGDNVTEEGRREQG